MAADVVDRLRRETPDGAGPAVDSAALFARIVAGPHDLPGAPRERRRPRRLAVVALLAVLVVAAPLALARGTHLLDFVFGTSPPPNVQKMFARMLPPDLGPHQGPGPTQKDVIRSSEKLVAQITTSSGAVARMYAVDLRTGGSCFLALGGPFNGGSCNFRPVKPGRFPVVGASGGWLGHELTYFGRATVPRAASLVMHFKDGAGETIPLSHSWFMYEMPAKHDRWGHEPTGVDVLDAAGRTIATIDDPFGLHQKKLPPIEQPLKGTKRVLAREPLGENGAFLELQSAQGNRGTQCMRALNTRDLIQTKSWICRSIANVTFIAPGTIAPKLPVTFERRALTATRGKPGGYTYLRGWVGPKVATLELRFQDSVVQRIPLHAGLFIYVVPPANWVLGKRPSFLVARDGSGRVIYRHSLDPLGPCGYPVAEKRCAGIIVASG